MSSTKKKLSLSNVKSDSFFEGQSPTRRDFLKSSLLGLAGLSTASSLIGCSSFNEYVFEDQFDLKDQLMIVGGGISGLYLAYKLRQSRSEYRLLEGSAYLGGRIRSFQGLDFGASVFERADLHMEALIKEFNLSAVSLSKQKYYLSGGAETLTTALQSRIAGLMPYRSLRLKWKFVSLRKTNDKFDAVFETPNGRRTLVCRKMALTLPPSQWSSVDGLLDIPEMSWAREWLKTLRPETITRVNWTTNNSNSVATLTNNKMKTAMTIEKEVLNLVSKNLKNNVIGLEFDYLTKQILNSSFKIESPNNIEIEKIVDHINSKTKLAIPAKKLNTDSFFDWSSVRLIGSAYFKNDVPFPEEVNRKYGHFQIFGDYSAAKKTHTVEGALLEADRVSSIFV